MKMILIGGLLMLAGLGLSSVGIAKADSKTRNSITLLVLAAIIFGGAMK